MLIYSVFRPHEPQEQPGQWEQMEPRASEGHLDLAASATSIGAGDVDVGVKDPILGVGSSLTPRQRRRRNRLRRQKLRQRLKQQQQALDDDYYFDDRDDGYGAPKAPAYEAPAPSYEAPAPSYQAPAPSYDPPSYQAPSYHEPSYGYERGYRVILGHCSNISIFRNCKMYFFRKLMFE